MPVPTDLQTIDESWSGGDPDLTAGLERMRKLLNALVNDRKPLSGNGEPGSGSTREVFVVAAEEGTGFIRVFRAQASLALGEQITSDDQL
jgi:hypothetical protein